MLREKLKHFKTIKLKRHHYVLWWFWIAAIVVFASIFWFQNIWTHAKNDYYDPDITIPGGNICTVINDTQVDVNWTWEINIYCKLWACHEEWEVIPNSILWWYNEKINISSMGNAVCLAACSSEKETNCLEANKLSQLQYDNIFTFTFQWISAWTSDLKLLANQFEWTNWRNSQANWQQITVRWMDIASWKKWCRMDISNPNIQINQVWTATISCKWTLTESPQDPENRVIDYNSSIIDLSNWTCGRNDDIYYCNFTYTWRGNGTTQFNLHAGSVFNNENELTGSITVWSPSTSVSCSWQSETIKVDEGDEWTIELTCTTPNLPSFDDMRSIITIMDDTDEIIKSGDIDIDDSYEDKTIYQLSFIWNNSWSVELHINWVLGLKWDKYLFSDKDTKWTIIVNGKSTPSWGPNCSIRWDSPVNLNNTWKITVTCKWKKLRYISEKLKAQTALNYSWNIEVKSEPEEIIPSDSSIIIKYQFKWIAKWTWHLKLNANIITEEWTPNWEIEWNEIEITNNVNEVKCEWLDWWKTSIDVWEIWSLVLSCNLENIHLKPELLQVEDGTKLGITYFINTWNANNDGWYHYEVEYKWKEAWDTNLIIWGEYSNEYTIPNTESPTITIKKKKIEPLNCSIIATWDTVYVDETGKIIVTCEATKGINTELHSTDLDYDEYIIYVQPTANRQWIESPFTYEFEYTWKNPPHTHLKLRTGVLIDSTTEQANKEEEYSTGIYVNQQAPADPIKCDIIATWDTVYVNETGKIIVTCDWTGYSDLTNTWLDYSWNITVSTNSDRLEESNKTKYTFTYTWDIAWRSHLKLLRNAIWNTQNWSTQAAFETWIRVLENIPDCNPNWDNNKFITPEFWKLDPAPTDPQIACALYGSGWDDQTAYTMWWDWYQWWKSCPLYSQMNVRSWTSLPTTLQPNTIYVLTSTWFSRSNKINLPKCSAVISNQINWKDTTIKITTDNNWIEIMGDNHYSILDNISIYWYGSNEWIYIQWSSNTLNLVKAYNREDWIFIDWGSYNVLNNIQSYGNEKWIRVKANRNAINNTQIYRNDMWLHFDNSQNNMTYNVEIYQNKTWLNVWETSINNTFEDIELFENKLNIYVLSWLESQNYAKWTLRQGPLPITKFYDFENQSVNENTRLTSVVSWFDRILLQSDFERSYKFLCEWGRTTWYTYTWENPVDFTWEAQGKCTYEHRGNYLSWEDNNHIINTWWWNDRVIDTKELLNTTQWGNFSYTRYDYPNNMTNPRSTNWNYLNSFFNAEIGNTQVSTETQSYSYWYNINQQKSTKLRNGDAWWLVNNKYFIWSNVERYQIQGQSYQHTKIHYTLTWKSTDTNKINKYNIITNLYTAVNPTILSYIWSTRSKTTWDHTNHLENIDINTSVELYVKTWDLTSYPVVVQMYGENRSSQQPVNEIEYFAEHKYATTLTRQAPTLSVQPWNMCVYEDRITMTGTRNGYEYDMTWFNFSDITVEPNATKVPGSFSKIWTWKYIWQIDITEKTWKIIVSTNRAEDILEFQNTQYFEKTYYRDIEGPEIHTTWFEINECTRKIIDIDASDYCAWVTWYKLEWNLGTSNWQTSSIFRINENIIWRTWWIKTWIIYVADNFWNTWEKIITWIIKNIPPEITNGQTQTNPYLYGTINWDITISQTDVIEMLWANEWACWTDDLSIESVSCDDNAEWTLLENWWIKIHPTNNTNIICSVIIKDNENSTKTWYIKFTANDIPSNTYNCQRSAPDPQRIKINQEWTIELTCDWVNFNDLTQSQRNSIINAISLENPSKLNYTVNQNTINITYTWAEIWTTKFQFAGVQLNWSLSLWSTNSAPITVYNEIYSWCTRWTPTQNPIWTWVQAYIDLICDNFQYHAENANTIWSVISYSGNTNAIYTWSAQWIENWVRFIYTWRQVWNIQLSASWDSEWYLYNSNGRSPIIKVIDYESNRPTCTITGTEMVTVWQAGTITVSCNGDYWITTTQLTNADLDYSGNILVSNHSNTVWWTSNTKVFTFTFTWNIAWVSNLWLKTWAVMNIPWIENRYVEWNDITVLSGHDWIFICQWKDPEPDVLAGNWTWKMLLDCGILYTMNMWNALWNFLQRSWDAVTGTLRQVEWEQYFSVFYTWVQDWYTQFAISWTIWSVHIQTDNTYRSKPIRVISTTPGMPSCTADACFSWSINVSCTPIEWITIHYTTDESNPDCESATWTNNQTFNETTTLKVIACNAVDIPSNIWTYTYTKDAAAPSTTANGVPSWWTWNDVTITLSATGNNWCNSNNTTYYCVANSWSTCTPTTQWTNVSVQCAEGNVCEKIVRYYSKDWLGNAETVHETSVIKIDKENPSCSITKSTTAPTSGNITLSVSVTETNPDKYSWTWWNNLVTTTWTWIMTGNGNKTFYVQDKAWNRWTCNTTVDNIDKAAPTGWTFNINNNAEYTTTTSVTLNTTCPTDPAWWVQVAYGNDHNPTNWKTCSAEMSHTLTNWVWVKTVYMRFKDSLGNVSEEISDDIELINEWSLHVSANNAWVWKTGAFNITLSITAWAPITYSNYSRTWASDCINSGTAFNNGDTITYSTEWVKTLYLCAKDEANQTDTWSWVYMLDTTNPSCSISNSTTAPTSGNVTLSVSVTEANPDKYSWTWWNNLVTTTWTWTMTGNGNKTFYVQDKAWNRWTCNTTVDNIDKAAPTWDIIVSYPSWHLANWCTSGNVILTLTWSDINGLATEPYSRDNTNRTGNASKILTGDEQWTWYIKDAVGNVTGISYNITWISHTWPSISLTTPESWSILTWFVSFAWSLEANTCQALSWWYNIAVYSWTEEIFTWNTGSTTIDTILPNWTYTWNVSAVDILWHTSTSDTWTLIINSQAPTCSVEYTPAADLWWTSGDVQSVLTWCSTWITITSADLTGGYLFTGNWTYVFTFVNGLGITWNTTATVTRIDKEPPVLHEIVPIGITTDTTPDYTFSSTESWTITYSWSCSSIAKQAISWNNTITLNALAIWTYSDCYIMVTDKAWNIGGLPMSEFTIKSSWGWWGGWWTLNKDYCPDWDYSDSYYDGTCEWSHKSDETRDICKVNESNYSDEMKLAYLYAYVHGMTTMCPIDDADLYGYLRRDHLAKILTQYSINVLDLEPEVWKAWCNDFDDIANESAEMKYFIRTSCELWLMWLESDGKTPKKSFDPTKYVTRAEFGTTLSRLIYEGKYNLASEAENTYPGAWYSKHLQALKDAEIMNEIGGDRPQHIELRWYVMLMVMRYGKWRLADMVTDEDANSYYMNNIYTKGNKEMSCTVYSGWKKMWDLYIEWNDIKEYNKTSWVSVLIKNNVLYTWSDSSNKWVSKKYTISVFNFLKKFDDEEISVQCTQWVDSDELIKPKNITFLSV